MPTIRFKDNSRQVTAAMRKGTADANREAVKGARVAANQVLPQVRSDVAGKLPGTTRAGATNNGAYFAQVHPGAALVNYGGTRTDEILPKNAQALSTPAGPRARVGGARRYRKSLALNNAVQRVIPRMHEPIKQAILKAYAKAGFEIR